MEIKIWGWDKDKEKSCTAMFFICGYANGIIAHKIIALWANNYSLKLEELIRAINCDCGTDATKRRRDAIKKRRNVTEKRKDALKTMKWKMG